MPQNDSDYASGSPGVGATVETGELANDSVTYAKLQNITAANRLLGRGSAGGAGDPEEIAFTGLTMSGTTLSGIGGTTGGTDNRVLRSDGAGGVTAQGSAVTIDDTGNITAAQVTANPVVVFPGYHMQVGSGTLYFESAGEYEFRINFVEKLRIKAEGVFALNRTITAAATTGNQTINKPAGTVNIAAAGTTITVTNSLVSATSIIFAVIRTNEDTAVIKNVVPGAGSFVINLTAAATAEVSIGFWVTN